MLRSGRTTGEFELHELARRRAAQHVAFVAQPGDVIQTCFGWPAYEAIDHDIAELCPLNTRAPVDPPRWLVDMTHGTTAPRGRLPEGARLEESFFSFVGDGARADVIELPLPPADQQPDPFEEP